MSNLIVIVRHGQDSSDKLSSVGIEQAERAGAGLLDLGLAPPVKVISSPLGRAVQTADVIAGRLGAVRGEHWEVLSEDEFAQGSHAFAEVLALLDAVPVGTGTIVLVGHFPFVTQFPAAYAKHHWDQSLRILPTALNGRGWILDLEAKRVRPF